MGLHRVDNPSPKSTGADLSIRACAWLALAFAIYGLWKALGNAGALAARWWITSDSLYPVHVFIDIFLEGNSFSGWKFSVAPCWFPDLFITALFMAVTQNSIAATLLAGAVQLFLLILGFKLLARALGWRLGVLPEAGAFAAGVAAALRVAKNAEINPGLLGQYFLPQTHVGSLILTFYALAAAVRLIAVTEEGTHPPKWLLLTFGAICFVGGVSDLLFIVQTLAPFTAAVGIAVAMRRLKARGVAITLGVGWSTALAGYAANRLLINTTDPSAQSATRLEHAFRTFATGFAASLSALDITHLLAVVWLSLTVVILLLFLVRQPNLRRSLTGVAVGAVGLAGVASIGAVIVGGSTTLTVMNDYQSTLRYLHPAFLLPVIAIPFLLLAYADTVVKSNAVKHGVAALLVLGALLPAISAARLPLRGKPITEFTPPVVEFLDELAAREELKVGVAGYWQARLITLLSKKGVRAYAVSPTMEPFLWVSNAEWYRPIFNTRPPQTDFVVLDDPLFHHDAPQARAVFGQPARTAAYQDVRVLLYRCNTCRLTTEQRAKTWLDEPLTQFGQQLSSTVENLALRPREQTTIPVKLTNPGTEPWSPKGRRPVNVGFQVLRDGSLAYEGPRTILPRILGGGETVDLQVRVAAPPEPGHYTVLISVVQEGIYWLTDKGATPLKLPLEVK